MTSLERQRRHRARMRIERETTHHHPEVHRLIVTLRRTLRGIDRAGAVVDRVIADQTGARSDIDHPTRQMIAKAWVQLAYVVTSVTVLLHQLEGPPTTKRLAAPRRPP